MITDQERVTEHSLLPSSSWSSLVVSTVRFEGAGEEEEVVEGTVDVEVDLVVKMSGSQLLGSGSQAAFFTSKLSSAQRPLRKKDGL